MLPVRKHCHSLTCILSKPSFCLREIEVQHMVLKFTCAPSQKTPAPQITSVKHSVHLHIRSVQGSQQCKNTVLCITKRRIITTTKCFTLWQKQWHFFNKKVMSDVPLKLSCMFPVHKFQYSQIVLLKTYFILSRNQESLSKTYSTSPETLQVSYGHPESDTNPPPEGTRSPQHLTTSKHKVTGRWIKLSEKLFWFSTAQWHVS